MLPKIEIKFDSIKAMASELSRISGRDFDYVLRSEAASCIKIAALKGSIASGAAIAADVKNRAGHQIESVLGDKISVNSRKAIDRVWFSPSTGQGHVRGTKVQGIHQPGNFYMVFDTGLTRGHHLPADKWALYLQTANYRKEWIRARTKELLQRRGLERLSWLQMADALGVDLDIVAPQGALRADLARSARVNGSVYTHGFVSVSDAGANYTFTVSNDSTVAAHRHGQERLDNAITQRIRGFNIAADKGLLDDLQRRAQRWPGIFVN